ncbi:MAG: AzlD family protein [Mesorhizobium sp.]
MTSTVWIILFGALATYATRIGGHLILSRFDRVHPRIEAGLNAVPAAVLTTLFAPALVNGGIAEVIAMIVAAAIALRTSIMPMFLGGAFVLVALRYLGL